jgi:AraC-like DNA-binding protein
MSSGHFSRSFRAAFGETPYSYLMTWRIERAMALPRRGGMSVTEVCFAVGCQSLGTFSARFTELVGDSPSAYRAGDHAWTELLPACLVRAALRPVRNREAATSANELGSITRTS